MSQHPHPDPTHGKVRVWGERSGRDRRQGPPRRQADRRALLTLAMWACVIGALALVLLFT